VIATVFRALALASASGNRIMTPIAALSWAAASGRLTLKRRPFSLLARPEVMNLLWLSALGEILVDKLPFTPSRTAPGPLAARVASGAAAAATQFVADGRSPWIGGMLGGVAGAAQSFAGRSSRTQLNHVVPNPISGVVEDLTTVTYALGAVARRKRRWIW
jgi:uncharacterized membrane protein